MGRNRIFLAKFSKKSKQVQRNEVKWEKIGERKMKGIIQVGDDDEERRKEKGKKRQESEARLARDRENRDAANRGVGDKLLRLYLNYKVSFA